MWSEKRRGPRLLPMMTYAVIVPPMETQMVVPYSQMVHNANPGRVRSTSTPAVGLVLVLAFIGTVGCAKKMAPLAPPPPGVSIIGSDNERLQESLFKGDQAVLSNQDIDRILTARTTLADRHRVAVLRLNARNFYYQEIADLENQNSERLIKALASSHLTQVRFMPTLLVPEKRTIPYLREAAARFQADLLFIYGTRVQTFQRDRLMGTDEVHAEAVVESVLLDVRTGIVIHSAQASEDISAKRTPGDLNFSQTIAKAQAEASGRALLKLAAEIQQFVNTADK